MENKINEQIKKFKKGIQFADIYNPANTERGIIKLSEDEINKHQHNFKERDLTICKFVPASGAASRMFKKLVNFANEEEAQKDEFMEKFLYGLENRVFPFSEEIEEKIENLNLRENKDLKEAINFLLYKYKGGLINKPKALIPFHKYTNKIKTALQEHIDETSNLRANNKQKIKIHLTVSPQHEEDIREQIQEKLSTKENISYELSFQKKESDTIAVDLDNNIFLDENDQPLLRPGGHGALIDNLSSIHEDIIFIKNIDNILPEKIQSATIKYFQALAEMLCLYKEEIVQMIKDIKNNDISKEFENKTLYFLVQKLFLTADQAVKLINNREKLLEFLNKPIRICGMIPNEGDVGGGPFWVRDNEGHLSLQIVETAQINLNDSAQKEIFGKSTYSNPVFILADIKNFQGVQFDLQDFIDHNSYFISHKSYQGRELKALELPGLWNGAMAKWHTFFVEVPKDVFSPVKTINDLIKRSME